MQNFLRLHVCVIAAPYRRVNVALRKRVLKHFLFTPLLMPMSGKPYFKGKSLILVLSCVPQAWLCKQMHRFTFIGCHFFLGLAGTLF